MKRGDRMSSKVTMRDIAREMGVSAVTVSKAISGKDGVGSELRAAIIRRAEEMGYVYKPGPSSIGKSDLKSNIGIVVAERFVSDDAFYTKLYRAVLMSAAEKGFSAILEIVTRECEEQCVIPNIVRDNKVDGIIFLGQIKRDYIISVVSSGLPFVFLDFYDDKYLDDSVVTDNQHGAYMLAKHMIEKGHRRIGFVGSVAMTSSILDRYLGVYKALLKNGLRMEENWLLEDRTDDGKLLERFEIPKGDMPDAFVCNNDQTALRLVNQLKAEGYSVPGDVSVVGFDDHVYASMCNPPLTTYRVDMQSMADAAVSIMIRKIKGKRCAKGMTSVSGSLIERDSVADRS